MQAIRAYEKAGFQIVKKPALGESLWMLKVLDERC